MTPLDAEAIAARLRDIASGLKLAGEPRFRVRAYERGAAALAAFAGDLDRWIAEGRLTEVPGIGERLASVIAELRATGTSKLLASVTEGLPPGALELARGPKLSLRAIRTLSEANVRTLEALRAAAKAGTLRELRGFSAKTEARLLAEMKESEAGEGRTRLAEARDVAARVGAFLAQGGAATIDVVGEVRRGLEVVDEVALLATSASPEAVLARFERYTALLAVDERDDATRLGRFADGTRLRLHATTPAARTAALLCFTGSRDHVAAVARAAAAAGVALDPSGAYEVAGEARSPLAVASEEALYARAGLAWVPPELRDGGDEVALAARGPLPRLVEAADLQGFVHCHTTYSDGRDSIEAMARAAEALGMRYLTITDHSPTAHYAGGLTVDRMREQWDEIARVQEKVTIRLLRGTEADILADGALDWPDAILEQLDVVVASVHNRYAQDERDMTARLVRAMRHPLRKIWGHALGRLLLRRPPIACDVDAVLDAAADAPGGAVIELSGDPYRLDMPPLLARRARDRGLRFVVSVDAHSTRDFGHVDLGVTMARRAGLAAGDVLNTLDADAFAAAVRPAR